MSLNLNSSTHSFVDDSSEYSSSAKLRRLKIQETLLRNSINKINPKEIEREEKLDLPMFYNLEFNLFTSKLKTTFNEIANMFEDIKAQTEQKLSNLDIDVMKKDVVKLDEKIRLFKNYLHTELTLVTSKEEEITKQVDDIAERKISSKIKFKARMKPHNHIVPSPVKVLIKSPLKCKEVQDFQDFMVNSPNRYGGWNEFNHNIFVQVWQKYFKGLTNQSETRTQNIIDCNVVTFEAFEKEILRKVPGSTKEDIMFHYEWYSKYLYLKEQQRNALSKWRRSQRILTKKPCKQQENENRKLDRKTPLNSHGAYHSENIDNVEGGRPQAEPAARGRRRTIHELDEDGSRVSRVCGRFSNCIKGGRPQAEPAARGRRRTIHELDEDGSRVSRVCGRFSNCIKGLLDIMETNSVEEIANALCNMSFQDENDNEEKDMNIEVTSPSRGDTNHTSQRSLSDISKPTKQWTNRCNSSDICNPTKRYLNLDNIKKLRIPDWRLPLQD